MELPMAGAARTPRILGSESLGRRAILFPSPPAQRAPRRAGRVRYQEGGSEKQSGAARHQPSPAAGGGSDTRTLLLAVDGSEDSEFAVSWVLRELQRPSDRIKLVHSFPGMQLAGRLVAVPGRGLLRLPPRIAPALLAEKARAEAEGAIGQKLMGMLEQAGAEGSFQLLDASAASGGGLGADSKAGIGEALCRTAREEGTAAVVVASASRGGLREALLGSVAAHLVHHCEVPTVVLHRPKAAGAATPRAADADGVAWLLSATAGDILRGGGPGAAAAAAEQAVRHLVVAVDDSDEALAAVAWVLEHLWRGPGDRLHVLHVVPALPAHMSYSLAPDGMMYSLPLPALDEAEHEEARWRQLLQERLEPLCRGADWRLEVVTDYGADPLGGVAAAVVAAAEALDAAALVVCAHAKGSVAEWLLGSVSDFAAHHCKVPVVVLHAPQFAGQQGGSGSG